MQISLIVAVAENGVIGANGELPWKLSSDLKTFRRLTLGKPVIMGRKTFDSLGKPLDARENIVLTSDPFFEVPGVSVVDNMQDALTLARTLAATSGTNEVMIIGGARVFTAAFPSATRIYLTEVHASPEGDVHFPDIDLNDWHEVSREALPEGPKDTVTGTMKVLERQKNEP
jgi:dihydrofolate reductase